MSEANESGTWNVHEMAEGLSGSHRAHALAAIDRMLIQHPELSIQRRERLTQLRAELAAIQNEMSEIAARVHRDTANQVIELLNEGANLEDAGDEWLKRLLSLEDPRP
jgi:hypothetical protein